WAGATGLAPWTTYYLRVYARTSCDNSFSAYTTSYSFTTSSGGYCTTPGAPQNVTATPTGSNTANLDWTAGSPIGSPSVTYYWVIGTSPTVTYGNGVIQGTTAGLWAFATGLLPQTTYYLRVYAQTSCNGSLSNYGTSTSFTTGNICSKPSVQASDISTSLVSTSQLTVHWTNGNGSRRVVKINTVNSFTPPINGTDPTASSIYGGSGEQIVYNGSGNSVNISGLLPNTTYWIRVYEANCIGIYSEYNQSSVSGNPSSQPTRTVVPSIQSLVVSNLMMSGNQVVDSTAIYSSNAPYAVHSPINIYVGQSNKTRFTLNASYAEGFSFQIVDQLTIVTDGTLAIDPPVYGRLGTKVSPNTNMMYVDFTLPENNGLNEFMPLKLNVLFEGGLIGMSFPLNIHMSQVALPVELKDFSGVYDQKEDNNVLSWTTSSELNNDYFEVERSMENSNFESIGRINGAETSRQNNKYLFYDKDISSDGQYLYRLKQVDLDGKFTYSTPILVSVKREENIKTKVFPNPASDNVYFQVESREGTSVKIDIFNHLGQLVRSNIVSELSNDSRSTKQLDVKDLGKGMYSVVFTVDGVRYVHKLIVIE
ncbi:MAG: T9SS type A sorting domain-containing protein, partial [Saprospiraceae bacterium]